MPLSRWLVAPVANISSSSRNVWGMTPSSSIMYSSTARSRAFRSIVTRSRRLVPSAISGSPNSSISASASLRATSERREDLSSRAYDGRL